MRRCAAQFGVRDDEQEFMEMMARGLVEAEVLHHHAVADVEHLRDRERLTVLSGG